MPLKSGLPSAVRGVGPLTALVERVSWAEAGAGAPVRELGEIRRRQLMAWKTTVWEMLEVLGAQRVAE